MASDHSATGSGNKALAAIQVVTAASGGACDDAEVFALQVLGTDMEPEFSEGDIIVVEPGGLLADGRFVVARHAGEWVFRQLREQQGRWMLVALDPEIPALPLAGLQDIRGVVIQKSKPGRRRSIKRYVD